MSAMREYESELPRALIGIIQSVPGTRIYGITDLNRLGERVPTVSFTLAGKDPEQLADAIGRDNIYVWNVIITPWPSLNAWGYWRPA